MWKEEEVHHITDRHTPPEAKIHAQVVDMEPEVEGGLQVAELWKRPSEEPELDEMTTTNYCKLVV
jgi:hypothetical protein